MSILASCEVIGDLIVATGDGTDVTGEGLSLINPPAWTVGHVGPLWTPGNVRGADVDMPGSPGVRPFRRRQTVTTHSLPFTVSGDYDYANDEPVDCSDDPLAAWTALENNLLYLSLNVILEPGTRVGTRDSILVMPSGAERFAEVHYLRLSPTRIESAEWIGTLDISVPDAWFQEEAS